MLDHHIQFPPSAPPTVANGFVDPQEARCIAAARNLIGDNVRKGLDEVRRLLAVQDAAYAAESLLVEEHDARHRDTPFEARLKIWQSWPQAAAASAAADAAGEAHYYAVRYVWKMPIRNVADAIAKAQFAMENVSEEDDDEDFRGDALHQIADFLAPQGLLQAAE